MNTLPVDDPLRIELHNEVHARPSARIRLPALIVLVGVFNSGFSREHILARAQGVDLAAVLVKPVSAEQLREQLMQVLQG